MNKTKKTFIVIATVLFLLAILLSIPFIGRYQMRQANSESIDRFNNLELYTPVIEESKRIVNGGDGIDSKPYLQVERELSINSKGASVEKVLRKNFDMQSLRIVETKYAERCNNGTVEALYRLIDKQGQEISINIGSDRESLRSACMYREISQKMFHSKDLTFIFARTYFY